MVLCGTLERSHAEVQSARCVYDATLCVRVLDKLFSHFERLRLWRPLADPRAGPCSPTLLQRRTPSTSVSPIFAWARKFCCGVRVDSHTHAKAGQSPWYQSVSSLELRTVRQISENPVVRGRAYRLRPRRI